MYRQPGKPLHPRNLPNLPFFSLRGFPHLGQTVFFAAVFPYFGAAAEFFVCCEGAALGAGAAAAEPFVCCGGAALGAGAAAEPFACCEEAALGAGVAVFVLFGCCMAASLGAGRGAALSVRQRF